MRNRMLLLYVSAGAGMFTAATFLAAPWAQALPLAAPDGTTSEVHHPDTDATWPMSAGGTRMAAPVPTFGIRAAGIGPTSARISPADLDTILMEPDTFLGLGGIPKATNESS